MGDLRATIGATSSSATLNPAITRPERIDIRLRRLTGGHIMSEKAEEVWNSDIGWVALYVVGVVLIIAAVFVVV